MAYQHEQDEGAAFRYEEDPPGVHGAGVVFQPEAEEEVGMPRRRRITMDDTRVRYPREFAPNIDHSSKYPI